MEFPDKVRVQIQEASQHYCCMCSNVCIQAHHIDPDLPPDEVHDFDNGAPLCGSCHTLFGDNPRLRRMIRQKRDHLYRLLKNNPMMPALVAKIPAPAQVVSNERLTDFYSQLYTHVVNVGRNVASLLTGDETPERFRAACDSLTQLDEYILANMPLISESVRTKCNRMWKTGTLATHKLRHIEEMTNKAHASHAALIDRLQTEQNQHLNDIKAEFAEVTELIQAKLGIVD